MDEFNPIVSPRSSNSRHSLVPPIIANEKDRSFLINLNKSIDEELGNAKNRYNPEQRYVVYKSAFNQVDSFKIYFIASLKVKT